MLLAALGSARVHLHNFPLFLGVVLAASAVTVAIFVVTARSSSPRGIVPDQGTPDRS